MRTPLLILLPPNSQSWSVMLPLGSLLQAHLYHGKRSGTNGGVSTVSSLHTLAASLPLSSHVATAGAPGPTTRLARRALRIVLGDRKHWGAGAHYLPFNARSAYASQTRTTA